MNAVELLKQDHRVVEGLFKQVEDTPPSAHPPLFKRIKNELDTHAHIEEVVFYPALKRRGDKELKDSVLEGIEEHEQMKKFLGEIAKLTPRNERYEPKLKVLIEDTRHHVKEEEGFGGMFSLAEQQLGDEALEKLGAKVDAERKKYQAAHKIKPEPRDEATGTLGSLVEKAKEAVSSMLGSPMTKSDAQKPRPAAKSNGKAASAKRSSGTASKASARKSQSVNSAGRKKTAGEARAS